METEIQAIEAEVMDLEQRSVLSPDEERFCQLYVDGGVSFAGQIAKCYKEVFGLDYKDVMVEARQLVRQPHITARIRELMMPLQSETEVMALKMQITETLRAVMEETSTSSYRDKFGSPLSPAPLRAVSVNAAKALMDMYPIKHSTETKVRIDGGQGGVVFNVIVPQTRPGNGIEE